MDSPSRDTTPPAAAGMVWLTVFFDDPFWVGLAEWRDGGALRAARHVFGAEPSDAEVLAFALRDLPALRDGATGAVADAPAPGRRHNPKRAARAAGRLLAARGGSTKAQEAARLQIEANKAERRAESKEMREAAAAAKRTLARAKAKERHRGR